MLGKDVVFYFRSKDWEVVETDKNELDITKVNLVEDFVNVCRPDVIINCAAYNFVDAIEEGDVYNLAFAINARGPRNLAKAAKNIGAKFVHYSTDYVFPGEKPQGYTEMDKTRSISKYGFTKEAGEKFVIGIGGDVYICRLSKIFGKPGLTENSKESFVSLMLRLAESKPELKIVNEEVGSPSYTPDIAQQTFELVTGHYLPGIFHIVNSGPGVTWYEFAKEFFTIKNIQIPYSPVLSDLFPKPAARPKFAALINTKLPPMRSRMEALQDFLN